MGLSSSVEAVGRRYDRLAPLYRVVEAVFLLPPGLRRRAVDALALRAGDTVLEVGCGSGRNLDRLVDVVGPAGVVLGVDVSAGMLGRARRCCERRGWDQVTLIEQDAADLDVPGPVDGVLFSLSYSVLPEPRRALRRTWSLLAPGGHLVVMDAGLPEGLLGWLMRPPAFALSRATVLGDPLVRPWDDLAALGQAVGHRRFQLGTYSISWIRKPPSTDNF